MPARPSQRCRKLAGSRSRPRLRIDKSFCLEFSAGSFTRLTLGVGRFRLGEMTPEDTTPRSQTGPAIMVSRNPRTGCRYPSRRRRRSDDPNPKPRHPQERSGRSGAGPGKIQAGCLAARRPTRAPARAAHSRDNATPPTTRKAASPVEVVVVGCRAVPVAARGGGHGGGLAVDAAENRDVMALSPDDPAFDLVRGTK